MTITTVVILKNVRVTKLFGHLTYEINNLDASTVLFLIGKNGIGKTTILKMIAALSDCQLSIFSDTIFGEIEFDFLVDDKAVSLNFKTNELGVAQWNMPSGGENFVDLPSGISTLSTDQEKAELLEQELPNVTRASCGRHWKIDNKGHYDAEEVVSLLSDEVKRLQINDGEMQYLIHWNVSLVSANRLEANYNNSSARISRTNFESKREYLVNLISDGLIREMENHVIEGAEFSRTFEKDYLEKLLKADDDQSCYDIESLKERLEGVNATDEKVQSYGIYPPSDPISIPNRKLQPSDLKIINIYLSDKEARLKPHIDFLKCLETFEDIINTSVTSKSIKPDRTKGIVVETIPERKNLKLDQLSSGEQHLIILGYTLLFSIPEKSYVLIDEPELSMHLEWQEQFAGLLDRIGELRELRFLCATHSPTILDSRVTDLRGIK